MQVLPVPPTKGKSMKLYIVVRKDIPPGLMLAQSCHALRAFVAEHPEIDRKWFAESNNIVVLETPTEAALLALADSLRSGGIATSVFTEPDLDDEVTAAAFGPSASALLANLPLALREAA